MKYAKTLSQEAAAAKAGMSLRTAKKYIKAGEQMVDGNKWKWRQTHPDRCAEVWSEVESMLETDPGLQSQTLM